MMLRFQVNLIFNRIFIKELTVEGWERCDGWREVGREGRWGKGVSKRRSDVMVVGRLGEKEGGGQGLSLLGD